MLNCIVQEKKLTTANKRVAVFFTGGTIAMRSLPDQGVVPVDLVNELSQSIHKNIPNLQLELVHWGDLPSPHISPEHMLELSSEVAEIAKRDDICGVVVSHGTDCMEETAFLLDVTLKLDKPVVVTGAMRSFDEEGYDGFRNLIMAIKACLLPLPKECGVAVLMADKLYSAREVTKVHSMSINSFDSPGTGAIGVCVGDCIALTRIPVASPTLEVEKIKAKVELIALAPGMDGKFIACARESGADGIVIEALGAGNIPISALSEVEKTLKANVPIVLTSRCIEGGVWPVYGYRGGAATMEKQGIILGGSLSAQKARILLMLALSNDLKLNQLKEIFHYYIR
ncbi:asparaginase [Desulfovibrio litoralis]|uniref:L-asparaginase n=1 Tax=Desulfovibrio litoralis DSM 11393 TaxID=1121455 RepID=A0A1M7S9L1_9BACT|nr:asparaginase [Desulfovibrio litoralis]SHN55075.1 L-asparaginase [Desulfovibrio litoralis DSM 11393]